MLPNEVNIFVESYGISPQAKQPLEDKPGADAVLFHSEKTPSDFACTKPAGIFVTLLIPVSVNLQLKKA